MTKVLLSSFILFLTPFLSFSQTQVSGNIQSNTTWTKANSPYILKGTVGVPAAYTLTIQPGVIIQRNADYQILINGAVVINGSQTDSITFTSDAAITEASKPFIEFQKSDLDNSSIRFVKFSNQSSNGYNIRMGNESEFAQTSPKNSGKLKIARSNLSNGYTTTKGYDAANSMNIDSCIISSANISGYYPRSERINISNSTVSGSTIFSDSYNLGIFLTNCKVSQTAFQIGCCQANLNFINSTISNSAIAQTNSYGSVNIRNSLFLNTPINIPNASINIISSKYIITDNALKGYGNVDDIKYAIMASSVYLNNSEFSGLNSLGFLYNTGSNAGSVLSITNNTINSFKDAVAIKDFSSIVLGNNSFSDIERFDIANYSIKDITTLNNYYQLAAGQTVDDVIFDSNDDLTYGVVSYTPYATTPLSTSLISKPKNVTKEIFNGNVLVKWNKNTEANLKSYKVYWGYIDQFTYAHVTTVTSTDSVLVLVGASITDSIAVTALNNSATGPNDQFAGNESWFSPAMLQASVLPVKLISFKAVSLNSQTHLSWETDREINNDHFDIEYSVDGSNFARIGSIKGENINNKKGTYSFVHKAPSVGINYYRLKQVDKDGQFEYSSIVKVETRARGSIAVYPNPATDVINIVSTLPISNAIIFNQLGQPVKQVRGSNTLQLKVNISDLPKGVYRIIITDQKQGTENISLIKQ